jgi:hypothetical protein
VNSNGNNVTNSNGVRPALRYSPEVALMQEQSDIAVYKGTSTSCKPFATNKNAHQPSGSNSISGGDSSCSVSSGAGKLEAEPRGREERISAPREGGAKPIYTFGELCDFQLMRRANQMAHRGKTRKPDVASFELVKGANTMQLVDRLQARRYRLSGYFTFTIYDPKERVIQALNYHDRVVMHALCDNILMPYFDKRLIFDNSACRPGKGTDFATKRIRKFLTSFANRQKSLWQDTQSSQNSVISGYALKIDVRKYFESIDKEVLIKRLQPHFKHFDTELQQFIIYIIKSYQGKGLPMGNQTSQIFAIFYLDALDRLIKEEFQIKYYSRYMDDLIIIHEDKAFLQSLLREIEIFCNVELHLELNQKKTQIVTLKQGFTYLGWKFSLSDSGKVIQRLTNQNKKRLKQKLKLLNYEFSNGKINYPEARLKLQALANHYTKGDTYKLLKKYRKYIAKIRDYSAYLEIMIKFNAPILKKQKTLKKHLDKVHMREYRKNKLPKTQEKNAWWAKRVVKESRHEI